MRVRRTLGRVLAVATVVGTLGAGSTVAATASTHVSGLRGTLHNSSIKFLGTTNVRQLVAQEKRGTSSTDTNSTVRQRPNLSPKAESSKPATANVANPKGLPVVPSDIQAYDGLNAADERLANDGNNYTYVPPDGGICRGASANSVQTVNGAFAFYEPNMQLLGLPVTENEFYGLPPAIIRTVPPTFPGPSLGDPKCAYDPGTGRMIILAWGTGQDPNTGGFTGTNDYFIAVSVTDDVFGDYYIYDLSLDPPGSSGCHPACLSDHPTLSTDANTVVTTYNKFNANSGIFEGARVVVMSKADMIAGLATPVVTFLPGRLGGGPLYTLQGANAPADGTYDTSNGGTMWFLSALQFVAGQTDNRLAIESLMNTSAIDTDPADIVFDKAIVTGSNNYISPPVIPQKDGVAPLANSLGEPLNYLDAGSDEMQPVWYAGGQLWGILDSQVGVNNTIRGGLLWMTVQPSLGHSNIKGTLTHQQFVTVDTNWLAYGAIAVNGAGTDAIITASWAGPTVYPSSVYGVLDTSTWKVASVSAYLNGVRPVDDFDCYPEFNPDFTRGCRFGDYNGASIGPSGDAFVLESEYITARTRVELANWGTGLATYNF